MEYTKTLTLFVFASVCTATVIWLVIRIWENLSAHLPLIPGLE